MRRTLCRLAASQRTADPILISINNATFYRQHPSTAASNAALETSEYDSKPIDSNPPLFPGLNFRLPSFSEPKQHWTVLSDSSAARTTFLQVLRGQHLCFPPTARSYPDLSSAEIAQKDLRLRSPFHAIQYVGFDAERGSSIGGSSMRGAYLSARYESRKEETDFSLKDYLLGNTELNADESLLRHPDESFVQTVMEDLKLSSLEGMPVTHLSNGQTRRARIAKALLQRPEVLLLDGPFMGLDPPTLNLLSSLLHRLAEAQSPRLILSLKPDEHIPIWITHMAFITRSFKVDSMGPIEEVLTNIRDRVHEINERPDPLGVTYKKGETPKPDWARPVEATDEELELVDTGRHLEAQRPYRAVTTTGYDNPYATEKELRLYSRDKSREKRRKGGEVEVLGSDNDLGSLVKHLPGERRVHMSRDGFTGANVLREPPGEALIEMKGVKVQYGDKAVLGDWTETIDGVERKGLWWNICRGQRWGVFGPNGSGKTTLISLICSDHPQTYSLPILLFGKSRLPTPGQPGISIFDIQSRIGHSSPEVHTFFPKHLSLRRAIESAWADTPLTRPKLTSEIDEKVSAALRWFQGELNPALGATEMQKREMLRRTRFDRAYAKEVNVVEKSRIKRGIDAQLTELGYDIHDSLEWADTGKFGELSFSSQRVALFIRAVIRNPDLVILDEAFSGMDDFARDKCHLFLSRGESAIFSYRTTQPGKLVRKAGPRPFESDISRAGKVRVPGLQKSQALIVISHKKEEVPGCVVNWLCLPESGSGETPRMGELDCPLELGSQGWKDIWWEENLLPVKVKRELSPQAKAVRFAKWCRSRGLTVEMSRDPTVVAEMEKQRERAYRREYYSRPDPSSTAVDGDEGVEGGENGEKVRTIGEKRREQIRAYTAMYRRREAYKNREAHLSVEELEKRREEGRRRSREYRRKLKLMSTDEEKAERAKVTKERRLARLALETPDERAERLRKRNARVRERYQRDETMSMSARANAKERRQRIKEGMSSGGEEDRLGRRGDRTGGRPRKSGMEQPPEDVKKKRGRPPKKKD
ncbi:hypothetical protein EJ08DRAFT_718944 [Tothia fuscella]|uniref:ABC transporter domain-containing protein n=1 Tax=Tothia fuscella TaxID=1048955 RepID=A0A9P4NP00_9PEZI|nr:hypothetical protein EJ08DRAFT_718944 [Tothia fuscella]